MRVPAYGCVSVGSQSPNPLDILWSVAHPQLYGGRSSSIPEPPFYGDCLVFFVFGDSGIGNDFTVWFRIWANSDLVVDVLAITACSLRCWARR